MYRIIVIFCFFIVLVFVFNFIAIPVHADGVMLRQDPYNNRWDYQVENNQNAYINYSGGLEKLILTIDIGPYNNSNKVWLLPIPSDPSKTKVKIVKNTPYFYGEEISLAAKNTLTNNIATATKINLILPVKLWWTIFSDSGYIKIGAGALSSKTTNNIKKDITVYQHLEENGITTEILTAKTGNAINNYLKSKNFSSDQRSTQLLNKYIGQDYSFIVSWITPNEIVNNNYSKNETRGLYITFPSQRIYFPLMLTGAYNNEFIPISVRVIGHVTPNIFPDIKQYSSIKYFYRDDAFSQLILKNTAEELKDFFKNTQNDQKYTKIEINAPAKLLTQDLWIDNKAPALINYPLLLIKYPKQITILLIIICSILSGIFTGFILFKDLRRNIVKLSSIGLLNNISIFLITPILLVAFSKTKNIPNEDYKNVINQLSQKGYILRTRLAVILLILVPIIFIFHLSVSFIITSPIIMIISWLLVRRKKEDKNLFVELNNKNISAITFQPKDGLKFFYVPLYVLIYILLSSTLIKIMLLSIK